VSESHRQHRAVTALGRPAAAGALAVLLAAGTENASPFNDAFMESFKDP
jgi:hypothetical protein